MASAKPNRNQSCSKDFSSVFMDGTDLPVFCCMGQHKSDVCFHFLRTKYFFL